MKKTALLHARLSGLIASLGHGDALVISDAGLPVPAGTLCIDLAVSRGVPSFLQVLEAVLSELQVESAVFAKELWGRNPVVAEALSRALAGVPCGTIGHEAFKRRSASARAIVRTGECTPFANVMLLAGVVF